jgi:hypothetical protein
MVAGVGAFTSGSRGPFTATAQFQVYRPSVCPFPDANRVRNDRTRFFEAQAELIKCRRVLEIVVNDPSVNNFPSLRGRRDGVEWLGQQLNVSLRVDSLILTMRGENPKETVALVNAVADAYFKEFVLAEKVEGRERLRTLHEYRDVLWNSYCEGLSYLGAQDDGPAQHDAGTRTERQLNAKGDNAVRRLVARLRIEKASAEAKLPWQPANDQGEVNRNAAEPIRAVALERDMIRTLESELESIKTLLKLLDVHAEVLKVEIEAPDRVRLVKHAYVAVQG